MSSSRRGCRSSCGAASRTTSCSTSRSRAGCAIRRCSSSRSSGCWRTRRPTRSSRTSPASGSTCASSRHVQTEAKNFDDNLRQSFRRETEMLFDDDRPRGSQPHRPARRRLHVRGRAARPSLRHPERPAAATSAACRSPADSPRRGLLGQGSMLTVTSIATRTSPVSRGKWILENLLGTPPPVPPPGVETNLGRRRKPPRPRSLRQRLERTAPTRSARRATASWTRSASRSRTSIWSATWRECDGPTPIDSTGQLADGTPLSGPADLRQARAEPVGCVHDDGHRKAADLRARPAGALLRHADGARDRAAGRRRTTTGSRRWCMGIIESDAFQKRVKK